MATPPYLVGNNNNKDGDVDDEFLSLVPNCHGKQIQKDIPPGLEIERTCDVSFFRLLSHRFFLEEEEPTSGGQQPVVVKAPKLENHSDWLASGGSGDPKTNNTIGKEWPLPTATTTPKNTSNSNSGLKAPQQSAAADNQEKDEITMMIPYCMAFCNFLWRRNNAGCWKKVRLYMIVGTVPTILSLLMGLFIDELHSDTSIGQTTWHQCINMVIFAVLMFVLFVISIFANYEYDKTVPLGALKFHLRQVIMRKLLLNNNDGPRPHPIAQTPGASVALLGTVVHDAINIVWNGMFVFILLNITAIATTIAAVLATAHSFVHSKRYWIVLYYIVFATIQYAFVLLLFYCRKKPIIQLSKPVYSWQLRYYSLGEEQLQQQIQSQSMDCDQTKEANQSNHATSTSNDSDMQQQQRATTDDQLQSYGDAAFIYRKRSFHLFFIQLVTKDIVLIFGKFLYMVCVVLFAIEVINGYMTVGTLVALIGCATLHVGIAEKIITALTNLPQGYMAIRQIADVINYNEPTNDTSKDRGDSGNPSSIEANHGTPAGQENYDEETALPVSSSSAEMTGL